MKYENVCRLYKTCTSICENSEPIHSVFIFKKTNQSKAGSFKVKWIRKNIENKYDIIKIRRKTYLTEKNDLVNTLQIQHVLE